MLPGIGDIMAILIDNMQWILLACGLLTFSMIQALFAPRATLRAYFGETTESRATLVLIRNWGALIAIGGLFLIYAAFHPEHRPAALITVGASKLVFITLLLTSGVDIRKTQAGVAIVLDSLMLILFAAYLVVTLGQDV